MKLETEYFETDTIKCPHHLECHGCQSWDIDYVKQLDHKKNDLKKKLNNTEIAIQVKTAGSSRLRTRFDFTVENQKMGLYGKDQNQNRELIDLSTCFQLTPELNKAFIQLKSLTWPFQKGSVRLRIAPNNKLGIWLDLANIDIKNMLLEKTFLMNLSKHFFIEIGQKKKTLDLASFDQPQLKLADPKPQVWFQTMGFDLNCFVSSFTQPSWKTADLITDQILSWLDPSIKRLIEYGCGIGQYTIPLLKKKLFVDIFETDRLAIDCLGKNLPQELKENLRMNPSLINEKIDCALVNPPRSGLKEFSKTIMLHSPRNIVYVSCYPESMAEDLLILSQKYSLQAAAVIDQFPQTEHYEAMVLLQRID